MFFVQKKYFKLSLYSLSFLVGFVAAISKASSISALEAEIEREYANFMGYKVPGLKDQPCLAVQFVYSLQEQLEQKQDQHLAFKILSIIANGTGVGGISNRQATKEERKVLFNAIYCSTAYEVSDPIMFEQNTPLTHQAVFTAACEVSEDFPYYAPYLFSNNFIQNKATYKIFKNAVMLKLNEREATPKSLLKNFFSANDNSKDKTLKNDKSETTKEVASLKEEDKDIVVSGEISKKDHYESQYPSAISYIEQESPIKITEGIRLLKILANEGNTTALYHLGKLSQINYKELILEDASELIFWYINEYLEEKRTVFKYMENF